MNNGLTSSASTLKVQPIRAIQPLSKPDVTSSAIRRRASAPTPASLERSVFQQINQYRQQQGLSVLRTNSTITLRARQHSQNMANSGVLSHDGFDGRVATINKTIRYRSAAENVAYNFGFSNPVAQAVTGWLNSPGHLENIVGNFRLTGVGVAKNSRGEYYFTQIFIQPQ
jgi:uncharacterized protein YkwD